MWARSRLKPIKPSRQKQGAPRSAENATINRELEIMRRAFTMGFDAEPQLVRRPFKFTRLPELNVRDGMFTPQHYRKLEGVSPSLTGPCSSSATSWAAPRANY